MIPKDMKASTYVFRKDVRNSLAKYMSGLRTHNSTISVNSMPSALSNEVSICANNDGGFNIFNETLFNKLILAQKIADIDKDHKFSDSEFEIFKELSKKYGNPNIGGVEISSGNLNNIYSISKDTDGKYTLKLSDRENAKVYRFAPQDENKKAKIIIPYSSIGEPTATNFKFENDA